MTNKLFQIGDLVKLKNRPYRGGFAIITKLDEPEIENLFKEVQVMWQDTLKFEEFYYSELQKVI